MNAAAPAPTSTSRALSWCLHLLVVALLALAAGRAVTDGAPHPAPTVAVAAACGLAYAAGPLLPRIRDERRAAAWWLAGVGALWLVLLTLSADAVWVAFPLYFLQLHLLPRRTGLAAVAATASAAVAGFAGHQGRFSAGMAIGPALGAAVAVAVVWGYEALYRESERRSRLIEELTATRAELAEAQHTAGVLAERERLAREIHDTLAQGLTSIQLLLRAAERGMPAGAENAARHVGQARQAAVDNLAEARRFVAALAPPGLEGTSLADALERLCATTGARHRLTARFRHGGEPVGLPTSHEVALLRIAQSALANTVRHARAGSVEVTLGRYGDEVVLTVADDGAGFDPDRLPAPDPESGGFGLAAMRARVRTLGGTLTTDSTPGHGTTLTARLPFPAPSGPETRSAEAGSESMPAPAGTGAQHGGDQDASSVPATRTEPAPAPATTSTNTRRRSDQHPSSRSATQSVPASPETGPGIRPRDGQARPNRSPASPPRPAPGPAGVEAPDARGSGRLPGHRARLGEPETRPVVADPARPAATTAAQPPGRPTRPTAAGRPGATRTEARA